MRRADGVKNGEAPKCTLDTDEHRALMKHPGPSSDGGTRSVPPDGRHCVQTTLACGLLQCRPVRVGVIRIDAVEPFPNVAMEGLED